MQSVRPARKHRVSADELPAKLEQMSAQLNTIENSDVELKKTRAMVDSARAAFNTAANALTTARDRAATNLRDRILAELPDLKLGSVDFMVERTPTAPSANGVLMMLYL